MDPRWQASTWSRLLLDAWRQVSLHLEVDACVEGLAARLAADAPLTRLWVRRFDPVHHAFDTVAVAPWEASLGDVPPRTALDDDGLVAVLSFLRSGDVVPLRPGTPLRRRLLPRDRGAPAWAGALLDGDDPRGVVVFESTAPDGLPEDLLRALLAPVVVALRNHQRMEELYRLREAAEADNRALLTRLGRDGVTSAVVGSDAGLRDVMARVERVSQTDAPVLILGETGTGKELVAREVHNHSARGKGPFLKVNCGAIPQELVDSELFGHEKGSFTGAVADRRGWFERADGGTLFLDEVGELSAAAQVRLLRVLQDGTFERVGGQRPLHADVRIVAATHRDLREMVAAGTFREDLWYRIGVFPLRLPPLRERLGDLPALVTHFAARAGERVHGRPLVPRAEDVDALARYPWPGNVRELAAVVERAAILGDGQRLDVRAALGLQADAAPPRRSEARAAPDPDDASLAAVNRRAIEQALTASRGKVEGPRGAAARLGLSPSTLRSRMKRLGVEWGRFRPED